jgi:hypothetical protein
MEIGGARSIPAALIGPDLIILDNPRQSVAVLVPLAREIRSLVVM